MSTREGRGARSRRELTIEAPGVTVSSNCLMLRQIVISVSFAVLRALATPRMARDGYLCGRRGIPSRRRADTLEDPVSAVSHQPPPPESDSSVAAATEMSAESSDAPSSVEIAADALAVA